MKMAHFLALIICFLFNPIHATEDTFPVTIENTSWQHKTSLLMQVAYDEKGAEPQKYTFVLEPVSTTIGSTVQNAQLQKKKIKFICLSLTNYTEIPPSKDTIADLLASVTFKPTIPILLELSFIIKDNTIATKPRYILTTSKNIEMTSSTSSEPKKTKK